MNQNQAVAGVERLQPASGFAEQVPGEPGLVVVEPSEQQQQQQHVAGLGFA